MVEEKIFFYRIFKITYLTAIVFDVTRIIIRVKFTKKYWSNLINNTGDPFLKYSTISSFFFHVLPMLHLKCCWVCLSFADTLAPAPLRLVMERGAPASSTLPPAPLLASSCSLAPRAEVAHPPLQAPSLLLAPQLAPSPSPPQEQILFMKMWSGQ